MTPLARKRLLSAAAALALASAGVGGFWWHRARETNTILVQAKPAMPALNGWPAEFRTRVESAGRSLQRGDHADAALAELATLYQANGFLDEARQCYAGLEKAGKADATALYRHAMIMSGYGQSAPAIRRLREAVRLSPDYLPARVRLGDLLLKENDLTGAAEAYGGALQRDPDHAHALLGQARVEMEQGEWSSARRHLETVVSQSNYTLGYDLIVTTYERLGLTSEANQVRARSKAQGTYRDMTDPWMDDLQSVGFDPAQLALTASAQRMLGNSGQARHLLERALRFAPDDAKLHFQLGLLLNEQRDYAGARTHLERCTQLDPTFPDGWVHLWDVLSNLGEPAAARQAFESGLRYSPNSYGLNLMRARELKSAGKLQEAIPYFEKVIQVRPTEPDAFIDLGLTYFALGNDAAGLEQFQRALVAEPGNPTVLSAMAFHAIRSGDADTAAAWLKRCGEQARVSREELRRLIQMYQQAFPGR